MESGYRLQGAERGTIAKKIEVGASTIDKTPAVLVSTPVYYKEWQNGNFLRHVEGHLKQRMQGTEALELNYTLNLNRQTSSGDANAEQDTDNIRRVLHELVGVQQMQKEINAARRESGGILGFSKRRNLRAMEETLHTLINAETDVRIREMLLLAAQRAGQVDISYVDISQVQGHEFDILGYPRGNQMIGSLRTFGLDYARKRLRQSSSSIFQVSDIDTLPSSNNAYHHLAEYYRSHPDVPFHFGNVAYQLPGEAESLFTQAPYQAIARIKHYSMITEHQSTQISCRASLLNDDGLESIQPMPSGHGVPIDQHNEDFATSQRLRALTETVPVYDYPSDVALTMDRLDGFLDGHDKRSMYGKGDIYDVLSFMGRLQQRIQSLPEETRRVVQADLDHVRGKYTREMQKQRRFYVLGARQFLEGLDRGTIRIDAGSLIYDVNAIRSESVRLYMNKHREFLSQLTSEDITWLRFCLGTSSDRPQGELTPKQEAIRDFFGVYQSVQDVKDAIYRTETRGRGSRLYGLVAEELAYGEIYRKHFGQEDVWQGGDFNFGFRRNDPNATPESITREIQQRNPLASYSQRTEWLQNVA